MATRNKPDKTLDVEDVFPSTQSTQLRSVAFPESPPEPEQYDDVTALNNVLAELGADEAGGGFVTVFRETIDSQGKKPDEYLERFQASDFSLDSLKERWGHGKYKINVYQDGRILTRKVITIARNPNAPIPTTAPVSSPSTDLTPILNAIQQSNEKMIAAMMALAQGQQKAPSRTEMLNEMAIMREMFAPSQPQAQQQFNPVELMKLGMEMANGGGGGGDGNNSWVNKMLETFGPALVPAITQAVTPRETAPHKSAIALPVSRPDTTTAISNPEENPVNGLIYNYLNMLTRAAEGKAPVEEYADSILSMIPPSNTTELEALLKPDDWREQMRKRTTVVEQYPEWFTGLRNTLLQYIEEDRDAASPEAITHLTTENVAGSVTDHENDNAGHGEYDAGDPASLT